MTNSNFTPQSRRSNLVVQDLDTEVLVYDVNASKAFNLNHTSAAVWQLCDGNNTIAQIAKILSNNLDSKVSEDLVWLAIDQLKKDNLLENSSAISSPFDGVSRREVIRKVGLASMIALPMVASLVAPKSANAASIRANGAVCASAANCQSGCCELGVCKQRDSLGTGAACTPGNGCSCAGICIANGTCL